MNPGDGLGFFLAIVGAGAGLLGGGAGIGWGVKLCRQRPAADTALTEQVTTLENRLTALIMNGTTGTGSTDREVIKSLTAALSSTADMQRAMAEVAHGPLAVLLSTVKGDMGLDQALSSVRRYMGNGGEKLDETTTTAELTIGAELATLLRLTNILQLPQRRRTPGHYETLVMDLNPERLAQLLNATSAITGAHLHSYMGDEHAPETVKSVLRAYLGISQPAPDAPQDPTDAKILALCAEGPLDVAALTAAYKNGTLARLRTAGQLTEAVVARLLTAGIIPADQPNALPAVTHV